MLVLPGVDEYHPTETGREIAALAQAAELLEPWKDPANLPAATQAVARYLQDHTPPSGLEIPAAADDVVYGFGRIDASGRVTGRAITSALGWRPGDRLTLTVARGVVIARRDRGGMVTMPAKPYVAIPAALRQRCGLWPGDRILLAVVPGQDALTAYSFAVMDQRQPQLCWPRFIGAWAR